MIQKLKNFKELVPLYGKVRVRAWQKTDDGKEVLCDDHTIKNLIVNIGKDSILKQIAGTGVSGGTGAAGTADKIGVGDNTNAAAAGDLDLQASTNKLWKQIPTDNKIYVRPTLFLSVDFGFTEGNFTWNELGLGDSNGDPPTGALWARQIDTTPLIKDNTKRAIVEWSLTL